MYHNLYILTFMQIITIKFLLQVLSYVEQSRQSFNNELTFLDEKMQEYKSKIDSQTRQFTNGSCDSPVGDSTQSLLTSSVKPIEEVMQSSVNGKVFYHRHHLAETLFQIINLSFYPPGTNHSRRVPIQAFF